MDWWTFMTRKDEPAGNDEQCLMHIPSCIRGPDGQWVRPTMTPEARRRLIDRPFPTCQVVGRHSHGGTSIAEPLNARQSARDRFSHPHEKEDGER